MGGGIDGRLGVQLDGGIGKEMGGRIKMDGCIKPK